MCNRECCEEVCARTWLNLLADDAGDRARMSAQMSKTSLVVPTSADADVPVSGMGQCFPMLVG